MGGDKAKYVLLPCFSVQLHWSACAILPCNCMMTSSNGNIFRVTGHLCGEFTGDRWIPRTKASDAELWCFYLICAWIESWENNGEAVDLRRHRAHYDVTVMLKPINTAARHDLLQSHCPVTAVTGMRYLSGTRNLSINILYVTNI